MAKKLLEPIPPGEILLKKLMKPAEHQHQRLSRAINVPPNCISVTVNGKRSITTDTALRLGKYFSVSPEIWLDLQNDYDIRVAQPTIWPQIEPQVRVLAARGDHESRVQITVVRLQC